MAKYKISKIIDGEVITDYVYRDSDNNVISANNLKTFEEITKKEEIEGLILNKGNYYINDIKLEEHVLELYKQANDKTPLINFFNWLALNPNPNIYVNIQNFIKNWGLEVTINGFLVMYRNVVKLKEGVYTSQHDKNIRYYLNEVTKMLDSEVDWNSDNTCSTGLHGGGKEWMKQSYYGDTPVQIFVNPMCIAACPMKDDYGKMRFTELYINKELEWVDGKIDSTYELIHDNDYATISFHEISSKLGIRTKSFNDLTYENKQTLMAEIVHYIDNIDYSGYGDVCWDDDSDDDEYCIDNEYNEEY